MYISTVTPKNDCRWFRGHMPCEPHKKKGISCSTCDAYQPLRERILVIKLGAAGDVVRTTPILRMVRKQYPNAEILWLTHFPDLVPRGWVNRILRCTLRDITWLTAQRFYWLINFDKDPEALALTEMIAAERKSGFGMDAFGKCRPLDSAASRHKWLTGLWDDANKSNVRHYVEEIFDICGYTFSGQEYIVEKTVTRQWGFDPTKRHVGLNTGCSVRWQTRLWKEEHWVSLINQLHDMGLEAVLLGGEQEHEKNFRLASITAARYPGFFSLPFFIDLVDTCDCIVTQATMAFHIALGLEKKLVLLNNIFNEKEFYLYGRGTIIQPPLPCLGCFKSVSDPAVCPVGDCMDLISPAAVSGWVKELLAKSAPKQPVLESAGDEVAQHDEK